MIRDKFLLFCILLNKIQFETYKKNRITIMTKIQKNPSLCGVISAAK